MGQNWWKKNVLKDIWKIDWEELHKTLDVNLSGSFLTSRVEMCHQLTTNHNKEQKKTVYPEHRGCCESSLSVEAWPGTHAAHRGFRQVEQPGPILDPHTCPIRSHSTAGT